MSRRYIFSSESVTEGHPDKVCDTISDYILDVCLEQDPLSRVACETLAKGNLVVLAGEITANAKFDFEERVRAAIESLSSLGAEIGEISLPSFRYALSAYYLIAPAECSSNLARYDGVRWGLRAPEAKDVVEMNVRSRTAGFGDEVKRRIMLGTYALSAGYYDAYYGKAQQVRTLVIRDFEKAYERFDVLLGPTSPTTAFKIGEKADDPLAMYLNDVFTIPSNLAGAAAISLPCGLAEDGLPVGLQLLGPPMSEGLLFKVAYAYEQARGPVDAPPLWGRS